MINLQQYKILNLYNKNTIGIVLEDFESKSLLDLNLIELVPSMFSSTMYRITKRGEEVREQFQVRAIEG